MNFNLLGTFFVLIFLSFISVAISFPMTRIIYQDECKGYFVKIFLKRFLCYMAVYLLLTSIFILYTCSISLLENALTDLNVALMIIEN